MNRIEPSLRLYTSGGRTGIEFPVDGGRIDLFVVDRAEKFVVIELKLSQGLNPGIEIVLRSASVDESVLLRADAIGTVYLAEEELANGMTRHVLQRFAPSPADTLENSIVRGTVAAGSSPLSLAHTPFESCQSGEALIARLPLQIDPQLENPP